MVCGECATRMFVAGWRRPLLDYIRPPNSEVGAPTLSHNRSKWARRLHRHDMPTISTKTAASFLAYSSLPKNPITLSPMHSVA